MFSRKWLAVGLFVLCTSTVFADDSKDHRLFFIDLGLGWSPITTYPSRITNNLSYVSSLPSASDVKANINLTIGFPTGKSFLFDKNTPTYGYWLLGFNDYINTQTATNVSYSVVNELLDVGYQFVTGNVIARLSVGGTKVVDIYDATNTSITGVSNWGLGSEARVGYDFNTDSGLGLCLSVLGDLSIVDSSFYSSLGLCVSLTYF